MNVAFFLIPKSQVAWIPIRSTLQHAMRQLEQSGSSALPVVDGAGRYAGAVTEGDVMRELHGVPAVTPRATERGQLAQICLRTNVRPVGIDAQIEELFDRAIEQSFVPVIDSREVFVGIVRRREILEYCASILRYQDPAERDETRPARSS